MKFEIKNQKKLIIAICCILFILAIGLIIYFTAFKNEKQTIAKVQEFEENVIVEEPIDEYININELVENEMPQQVIETNEINNTNTNKNNNTNTNTNKNNNINKMPYYIKVNYGAQVVTIYTKDEQGNYTIPVKAMVCSTGVATPTSGIYKIPARWLWLGLQGNVYGQYSTQITGNILFHSVPYLTKGNPGSLEYWEYDKLGTYASAGCIRLTVKDAKWIYENCAKGTNVEFYSSSDPGPLGKPSAKKISNYPENLRNWDPTDPNENNPWRTYKEEKNEENKTQLNKNEVVNETKDVNKNEVVNETKDENKNEVVNETKNEIENEMQNEEKCEDTNTINYNNTLQ